MPPLQVSQTAGGEMAEPADKGTAWGWPDPEELPEPLLP